MSIPIMNPRRYAAGPRPRSTAAAPLAMRYGARGGDDGGEDAETLTPQAPGGGGAARNYGPPPPPGVPGGPQQQPPVSNFRRSLDLSRYNDAAGAAAFAAAAPPALEGQSAYGTGARGEQAAAAGKAAYLARTRSTANAQDPYGTGPGQLDRAEDRTFGQGIAKQQADTETGYVGALGDKHMAEAHHLNQEADVGVPAQAARVRAAGELDTAHAGQVPGQVAAENQVKGADAAYKTAQANNVAAGGTQDKAELAQLRKDHATALKRIHDLESLLARQKPADDPEASTLPPPTPTAAPATAPPPPAPAAPAAPPSTPGTAAAGLTYPGGPRYAAPPAPNLPQFGAGNVPINRSPAPQAAAGGAGRKPSPAEIAAILQEAGGDKAKATQIALSRGLDPYQ